MAHAEDREKWFTYRSERLKTFMDAWLQAHSLRAIPRPAWNPADVPPSGEAPSAPAQAPREKQRRSADTLRRHLRDVAETLGSRDLDVLCAFADFLRARRVMRSPRAGDEADEADDVRPDSEEK
jgi:hypothetical protein